VRASNVPAQAFYKRLGFAECGRLRAQVIVDGGRLMRSSWSCFST
jgi:ribosomal protein S18 acetylase RimI-like enzyme